MPKKKIEELCNTRKCCMPKGPAGNGIYCLGVIGSLFFHLQNASGFVEVIAGIFKSFVWPALLVYRALGMM